MNYITEKLLESLDDFAVKNLDDELNALNMTIDKKIEKGLSYKKESIEHKKVVKLREQIMFGL